MGPATSAKERKGRDPICMDQGLVTSRIRTGAFQMHGLDLNLSDRDLKKKEEKELGVCAYITDYLLTKPSLSLRGLGSKVGRATTFRMFDYYS